MEQGFVVVLGGLAPTVSTWVGGSPVTGWTGAVKVKDARQITTYRCTGCGFLESYAR